MVVSKRIIGPRIKGILQSLYFFVILVCFSSLIFIWPSGSRTAIATLEPDFIRTPSITACPPINSIGSFSFRSYLRLFLPFFKPDKEEDYKENDQKERYTIDYVFERCIFFSCICLFL